MAAVKIKEIKAGHFAALPYRFKATGDIEVLFVTTRETAQWIIPKGKPEIEDGKPVEPPLVAKTEAKEEAGVVGDIDPQSIGYFLYDKYKGKKRDRADRLRLHVYLLEVKEELTDYKEKGQRQREWISIEGAIERLCANRNLPDKKNKRRNMQRLFAKAVARITAKHAPKTVASAAVAEEAGTKREKQKRPKRKKTQDFFRRNSAQ